MNDWTALFHSLTADTLDSLDTVSIRHFEIDVELNRWPDKVSVQSVKALKREEEEGHRAFSRGRRNGGL
jgi:hypothetical protein